MADENQGISYRFEGEHTFLSFDGREYRLADLLDVPSNSAAIAQALTRHPARYARWSFIADEAAATAKLAKEDVRYVSVMMARNFRAQGLGDDEHGKPIRVTDSSVSDAVTSSQEYKTAMDTQIEAELAAAVAKSFVQALETRGHILLALNANARQEMVHERNFGVAEG